MACCWAPHSQSWREDPDATKLSLQQSRRLQSFLRKVSAASNCHSTGLPMVLKRGRRRGS
jgi:hypothetical protein